MPSYPCLLVEGWGVDESIHAVLDGVEISFFFPGGVVVGLIFLFLLDLCISCFLDFSGSGEFALWRVKEFVGGESPILGVRLEPSAGGFVLGDGDVVLGTKSALVLCVEEFLIGLFVRIVSAVIVQLFVESGDCSVCGIKFFLGGGCVLFCLIAGFV